MAQTITEVEAQMNTEQASQAALAPLNSPSSTAIYQLWKFITATIIVYFETVMDLFTANIQTIINNNQYGTDFWWQSKMLAFQYGDLLVFLNNIFQYAVIDPTKQIIAFCSITSVNGVVQIKVASSTGGVPTALTSGQLSGAISYCSQIQPSGVRFAVLSIAADLVQFYGNIYYDASADITVVQPAVEAAINAFLDTNNTTNFNGILYVNSLIAAIEPVPGLNGNKVDVVTLSAKNGGSGYTAFTSSYQPESGYFMIDPAYPLSATLTYIPYIAP